MSAARWLLAALLATGCASTPPQGTLTVENRCAAPIHHVRLSRSDDCRLEDRLGPEETIAPGARRSFALAPGAYDVAVELAGGRTVERHGAQVEADLETVCAVGD